jgi:TolC family type I secretion outer membrane protein
MLLVCSALIPVASLADDIEVKDGAESGVAVAVESTDTLVGQANVASPPEDLPAQQEASEQDDIPTPQADLQQPVLEKAEEQLPAVDVEQTTSPERQVEKPDVIFREALRATYLNNPRIIAERRGFEETSEQFNQAFAAWLPTINLEYRRGRRRNRVDNEQFEYFDAEDQVFRASQPIVDTRAYFEVDATDNTVKARGAQLVSITQEVLLRGVSAYADVVRDQQILKFSRENVEVLKESRENTRERFDYGETTRTDLSQAEARVSRAISSTIRAIGNLSTAKARFERIVGHKPTRVLAYPDALPALPKTLEEAIDIALRQNPRIVQARYTEQAAEESVAANKADLLPTVRLDASASRSEGSGLFGANIDTDDIVFNVTLPLYRGGAQYARIRELQAQQSRRQYELNETTNEVQQQVTTAWANYVTALADIKAQKDTILAAEIALAGVKEELLYGSRTVLDVLDAEDELFNAKVALARAQRDKTVAMFNLLAVLGKLSPATLGLDVKTYDRDEVYSDIKYEFIGF